jgi:LUD domain
MDFTTVASQESVEKTIAALQANNIIAEFVQTGQEAKEKVLAMVPQGAEVMNMTSVTLDTIGVSQEIMESGKYNAVKKKLMSMDRKTQGLEMQKLGAAPEWTVGSVHAVTEDGKALIASNTGSQLSAYVYGSPHVIWVVGTQKIVPDFDIALKRLYEHTLPLENERAHKAYGTPGSFVSKLLIVNREVVPGRIHIIFVNEVLGF